MKRMSKRCACLILVALIFSLFAHAYAFGTDADLSEPNETNPYVQALFAALEENDISEISSLTVEEEIETLTLYYEADLALKLSLGSFTNDEDLLSSIVGVGLRSKILAMQKIAEIYDSITDADCLDLIQDFYIRYAPSADDAQITEFYNNLFGFSNHSDNITIQANQSIEDVKAAQEMEYQL